MITAGQRGDSPQFEPVLEAMRVPRLGLGRPCKHPDRVRADKAYDSRRNRSYLRRRGIKATIPVPADRVRNRLDSSSVAAPSGAGDGQFDAVGASPTRGTIAVAVVDGLVADLPALRVARGISLYGCDVILRLASILQLSLLGARASTAIAFLASCQLFFRATGASSPRTNNDVCGRARSVGLV